jgi:hypothetical protein
VTSHVFDTIDYSYVGVKMIGWNPMFAHTLLQRSALNQHSITQSHRVM